MNINFLYRDKNYLVFGILFLVVMSLVLVIVNSQFLDHVEKGIVRDVENELFLRVDDIERYDKQLVESAWNVVKAKGHGFPLNPSDIAGASILKGHLLCHEDFEVSNTTPIQWDRILGRRLETALRRFPHNQDLVDDLERLGPQKDDDQELYRLVMQAGSYYAQKKYTDAVDVNERLAMSPRFRSTDEAMMANVACLELATFLKSEAVQLRAYKRLSVQIAEGQLSLAAIRFLTHQVSLLKAMGEASALALDDLKEQLKNVPIVKFEDIELLKKFWRLDKKEIRQQFLKLPEKQGKMIVLSSHNVMWMVYQNKETQDVVASVVDVDLWSRLLTKAWANNRRNYSFQMLVEQGDQSQKEFDQNRTLSLPGYQLRAGDLDADHQQLKTIVVTQTSVGYAVAFMGFTILGLGLLMGIGTALYYQNISKLKTSFVSTVSHELRTPLTSIQMFVETLKQKRYSSEEEREECINIIERETARLNGLIERLLTFSSLEQNKESLNLEPIALNRICRYVLNVVKPQIEAAGMQLKDDIVDDEIEIKGDGEALVDVFLNLLSNAIKYARQGKEVELALSTTGHKAVVEVRDRGPGIPKADRKRMFKAFARQENKLTQEEEGVGLGLSIVKQMMDRHGGSVSILSRKGGGAVFKLEFPLLST